MRRISGAKRARAIKLRVERQLSTPIIARRVGISNHSAYKILKKHPWRGERKCKTDWTIREINDLMRLWPAAERAEIAAALPKRTYDAAGKKASAIGLRRHQPAFRRNRRPVHPVVAELEKIRRRRMIKRETIAKASRLLHVNNLLSWALGKRDPHLKGLSKWANAMGYDIVIRRRR